MKKNDWDDLESIYGSANGKPNGACRGAFYALAITFLGCTVLALVIIFITTWR